MINALQHIVTDEAQTSRGILNMSMRTYLSAIASIEELRSVVGCKDKGVERLLVDNAFGKVNLKKMSASDREYYEEKCEEIGAIIEGTVEVESYLCELGDGDRSWLRM